MPPSTRMVGRREPLSASAASSRSAPRWAMPSRTARTISGRPVPRVRPSSVPRAPKSQAGVPMPSSEGTNHTSPVSRHRPATSSDSADDEMRPRSSRTHSTAWPAVSMNASSPHVTCPPRRQATIGNVPDGPLRANAGGLSPRQTSSIPPVPNVILAMPGRVQPWPMSDACWSPAMPAMGGEPGSADASPDHPRRVDDRRHHPAGMSSASRRGVDHPGRPGRRGRWRRRWTCR